MSLFARCNLNTSRVAHFLHRGLVLETGVLWLWGGRSRSAQLARRRYKIQPLMCRVIRARYLLPLIAHVCRSTPTLYVLSRKQWRRLYMGQELDYQRTFIIL